MLESLLEPCASYSHPRPTAGGCRSQWCVRKVRYQALVHNPSNPQALQEGSQLTQNISSRPSQPNLTKAPPLHTLSWKPNEPWLKLLIKGLCIVRALSKAYQASSKKTQMSSLLCARLRSWRRKRTMLRRSESSSWLFCKLRVLFMGVVTMRALLFGVIYCRAL